MNRDFFVRLGEGGISCFTLVLVGWPVGCVSDTIENRDFLIAAGFRFGFVLLLRFEERGRLRSCSFPCLVRAGELILCMC